MNRPVLFRPPQLSPVHLQGVSPDKPFNGTEDFQPFPPARACCPRLVPCPLHELDCPPISVDDVVSPAPSKGAFAQLRPCRYPGHRVTVLRVPLVVLSELPVVAGAQAGM